MRRTIQPAMLGFFTLLAIVLAAALIVIASGRSFFAERHRFVMFFEEDISGLDIGAPVEYRGGRVGTVSAVALHAVGEGWNVQIPVFIEIEPERVTRVESAGRAHRYDRQELVRAFAESGLRARLASQSILTGKLKVQLVAEPGVAGHTGDPSIVSVPQIPTIRSRWTELSQTIESLPLNDMVTDAAMAIDGLAAWLNDPLTTGLLAQASQALQEVRVTNARLAAWLEPGSPVESGLTAALSGIAGLSTALTSRVTALTPEEVAATHRLAQTALTEFAAAGAVLRLSAGQAGPLAAQASDALGSLDRTLRAVRALADYLERHPEAMLRGKAGENRR